MSWFGKVLGGAFGFLMGGPLGAALGAALGHQIDQGGFELRLEGGDPEETLLLKMAFFRATFQIMGHIAKADGRVTPAEIEVARGIMDRMMLPEDWRVTAMRLYNEGKSEQFLFDSTVEQFRVAAQERIHLLRLFIALQMEAALADGALVADKERLLLRLCERLHFSRYEFYGIRARMEAERKFQAFGGRTRNQRAGNDHAHSRHQYQERQWQRYDPPLVRNSLDEAFKALGLRSSASVEEIKRAYRRQISQHHPDKLEATGASQERMQKATEETQKIQKAYEAIQKARRF